MYAVVRTGGKQYKVTKDAVLTVKSLVGDVGSKLTLGEVLLLGGDSPKLGAPLVKGKRVTGFTDGEEEGVGLAKVVPFLVEDELISLGAKFEKTRDWGVYVIQDGLLIAGQNPASSGPAAKKLLEALAK